ncbi:alpha-glucosides permease MPH2/3 [Purpureocillium lavendulum]|uniref:Alpha-glucosides permease MPH2/3 n=1 Tax=Purpureocillium lavendulum TaxID=1247861 RepID=A0AB34FGA0_9HYPO|nr:alpha-glucosides permease MPH2/3 [Purpureocillium lavendulum]
MGESNITRDVNDGDCLCPGQLLPTEDTLRDLRDKFLSVFDVPSVLESQSLSWYYIHRDFNNADLGRAPPGPIPGNDFHATDPRIVAHLPAWGAYLQFETPSAAGEPDDAPQPKPLLAPFRHISSHPDPGPGGVAVVEHAARLVKELWPDAVMGPSRRRHVGLELTDTSAPEYHIFHWLASKQLNAEGVALCLLSRNSQGRLVCSSQSYAFTAIRDRSIEEVDATSIPAPPSGTVLHGKPFSSAQIWSFTRTQIQPLSFPVIAAILCLLSDPTKNRLGLQDPFADREVTWCLDGLHGFSRGAKPEQGPAHLSEEKSLSSVLGTSSNCWMHFHVVLHFYGVDDPWPSWAYGAKTGSGVRVDRGRFTLPIRLGHKSRSMAFIECRTWIAMRVATPYQRHNPAASPAAVGVIVGDTGHRRLYVTEQSWDERGIQSPAGAGGVALFQMVLWSVLDDWEKSWNRTFDQVEQTFQIRLDSQRDVPRLDQLLSDTTNESPRTCSKLILLLTSFRSHIDVVADSVRDTSEEWSRTYSGRYTARLERFDVDTQEALLQNWKAVLAHLEEIQTRLHRRIGASVEKLRLLREGFM